MNRRRDPSRERWTPIVELKRIARGTWEDFVTVDRQALCDVLDAFENYTASVDAALEQRLDDCESACRDAEEEARSARYAIDQLRREIKR